MRRLDAAQDRFSIQSRYAPMQQFACLSGNLPGDRSAGNKDIVYMPLHGFSAVDLGYQQGNAVSNIVTRIDDAPFTATWVNLFDQIWNDPEKRFFAVSCG
jgi:hypothetical protein